MFRKSISMILLVLLVTVFTASLEQRDTIAIKNSVDMRNGPGSYYKLILRLNSGAEVSQMDSEQQWLKVKTQTENKEGWIPERAAYLEDQKKTSPDQDEITTDAEDAFDEFADKEDEEESDPYDPYASPAQVAAAVKGFAEDFTSNKTETDRQEEEVLENFEGFVNPADYQQFRNQRLRNWSWEQAQSRFPLETGGAPVLNPQREQVGWGIANVIAQQGLLENESMQQYLTHIALIVAENTHRYETPVQVYILDSNDITGYASPNGAIFVSKGSLDLMETEAEFAFFVAHELAHIVLNHGVKETKKQKSKIMAEQRFEELDREIGERDEKYVETEEELTEWANQVYQYTIKDRLQEYEYEADYWGVAYTYRTGYNPRGGLNFLQKIYDRQGDFEDKIGMAKWEGTSLRDRIIKIDSQIGDLDIPQNFGNDYRSHFQQMIGNL